MVTTDQRFADEMAPMAYREYRAALARLNLNNTEAARLFGISSVSSRRFSSGLQTVPPTLARLVRLIEAQRLTAEQVRSWLAPPPVAGEGAP
jgi:hypothetical protein